MDNKTIFSANSLKKANQEEMFNETIHVTGYGAWMIVIAAIMVLAAIIIWSAIFSVKDVIVRAGECKDGVLTIYLCENDTKVKKGTSFTINDREFVLTDINDKVFFPSELPDEIKALLPEDDIYRCAVMNTDIQDGYYYVNFEIGKGRLISFLMGGK